jgi:hypothetical protein
MLEIKDLLDRFEILYPDNEQLKDFRRAYTDKDMSSIFRLLDNEDLRKAVIEENLYSIFRLVKQMNGDSVEELRKAVTEKNLHSVFRLQPYDDLRKLVLEDNTRCLWKILAELTNSNFVKAFNYFDINNVQFDQDCFSQGQLKSKMWLVTELKKLDINLGTVFLCAGWYATLATMLFEGGFNLQKIRSFDIDPSCEQIAERFNKIWEANKWMFKASTADIFDLNYSNATYTVKKPDGQVVLNDIPDTIINTSCEHIADFDQWYNLIPNGKLVVLQTNDYFEIEDHVNCSASLDDFAKQTPMSQCLYQGVIDLGKYRRFMRIGKK